MLDKEQFYSAVSARLMNIFKTYADGGDIAPALLYRTEGFIEAGCELGLVNEEQVNLLMKDLHQQIFHTSMTILEQPGVNIPMLMKRAPVYPSTK